MKATGIVRRIDALGRVVIPKEIRRSLRIREGEPLEIFTSEDGGVVFRKYSPIGEVGDFTGQYAEAIQREQWERAERLGDKLVDLESNSAFSKCFNCGKRGCPGYPDGIAAVEEI